MVGFALGANIGDLDDDGHLVGASDAVVCPLSSGHALDFKALPAAHSARKIQFGTCANCILQCKGLQLPKCNTSVRSKLFCCKCSLLTRNPQKVQPGRKSWMATRQQHSRTATAAVRSHRNRRRPAARNSRVTSCEHTDGERLIRRSKWREVGRGVAETQFSPIVPHFVLSTQAEQQGPGLRKPSAWQSSCMTSRS